MQDPNIKVAKKHQEEQYVFTDLVLLWIGRSRMQIQEKQFIATNTGRQIQIVKQAHRHETSKGQLICKQHKEG